MIPPATTVAPAPDDTPDSFGARCAKRAALENLIAFNSVKFQLLADLINDERRKLIAASKAPQPAIPCDSTAFGDRKAIPPTPEQVTAYSASIGYPLDGHEFCDSYAAKNWMVGRVKMKDWQAAVRNWKRNGWGHVLRTGKPSSDQPPRSAY